jgi:hypothetical protein
MHETQDLKQKQSGTETRQRIKRATTRFTPAELAQVEAQADKAGLALGSYIRAMLFTARPAPCDRLRSIAKRSLNFWPGSGA